MGGYRPPSGSPFSPKRMPVDTELGFNALADGTLDGQGRWTHRSGTTSAVVITEIGTGFHAGTGLAGAGTGGIAYGSNANVADLTQPTFSLFFKVQFPSSVTDHDREVYFQVQDAGGGIIAYVFMLKNANSANVATDLRVGSDITSGVLTIPVLTVVDLELRILSASHGQLFLNGTLVLDHVTASPNNNPATRVGLELYKTNDGSLPNLVYDVRWVA